MSELLIRNRQRARKIDLRLLRKITLSLLQDISGQPDFELGIHLVSAREMAKVNETFLQHTGSTDVITFDYGQSAADILPDDKSARQCRPSEDRLHFIHGEIFICIDDAVEQADKFQTSWQSELVRYVVHGILHLRGFDDLESAARREMKRAESRWLKKLAKLFPLKNLERSK